MELTLASYQVVARLPGVEKYDLGSQIRRSAVSVPANIAEGYAIQKPGAFLRHLSIAAGSLAELQTLLTLAELLGYCTVDEISRPMALARETELMLHSLRRAVLARRDGRTPTRTSPHAP